MGTPSTGVCKHCGGQIYYDLKATYIGGPKLLRPERAGMDASSKHLGPAE